MDSNAGQPADKGQPATETQKPTQVPDSQGPNTPDTSKQAPTVQKK
jgi:hypothetical protein